MDETQKLPPSDEQIKLYGLLIDQVHKHGSVMWQFPIALGAANAVALDKIATNSELLVAVAVFDAVLVHAFYRLVTLQKSIVEAVQRAEEDLRGTACARFIPIFRPIRVRAALLVVWTLAFMTFVLFASAIYKLFQP